MGGGLTYSPTDQIDIDFDGGYSISRDFEYYRGDASKTFKRTPRRTCVSVSARNFDAGGGLRVARCALDATM